MRGSDNADAFRDVGKFGVCPVTDTRGLNELVVLSSDRGLAGNLAERERLPEGSNVQEGEQMVRIFLRVRKSK